MTNWLNPDSLYVKFGRDKGTVTVGGVYEEAVDGGQTVVKVRVTLADLSATPGTTILSDVIELPRYARIEKVQTKVVTAATGSGAQLNFGLKKTDRTTEGDYDGLIAAMALTDLDLAGETVEMTIPSSNKGGALVGTTLGYNGLLCADYDTAAFTAGVVDLYVFYTMASNRVAADFA